ncbi:MAG: thermonuclease family protein [Pseudomonadota bacterium]
MRRRRRQLACVLSSLALVLMGAAPARPSVVDGDTFILGADRIRLWGVDAPEGRQVCQDGRGQAYRCGDMARDQLKALIGDQPVDCRQRDRDQYGRSVAQCRAGGVDLGEAMVRLGWAVEYRTFSYGAYVAVEAQAKAARRGLWAGTFESPSAYRADERAEVRAAATSPPSVSCVIKGNINAKGRRIFHQPGQRDYSATVIDAARGERWFCSPAEAQAQGWTPSQR